MNRVSLFDYKETQVNLIYRNGFLGYTFEKDGKTYGNKIKLDKKDIETISNVSFLLFLSFIETREAVEKL